MQQQTPRQQQQHPFVLSFHILKLQLVDRAPGDEAWERGFKQNWSAATNRISCRLLHTVTALPDDGTSSLSTSNNSNVNANNNRTAASSSQNPKTTATQVLATTPPLIIDPKTMSAVVGGVSGTHYHHQHSSKTDKNISTTCEDNSNNNHIPSLLVVPNIESLMTTSPVLLMEVCRHTMKQPNTVECRTTFNLVAMAGSLTNNNTTNGNASSSSSSSSPSNDFSSVSSFIVEHTLMHPVSPMSDSTIFVIGTVAMTKQSLIARITQNPSSSNNIVNNNNNNNNTSTEAEDDTTTKSATPSSEKSDETSSENKKKNDNTDAPISYIKPPLLTSVPQPPTSTLERLSGSIRLSTTDLFVPSLIFTFPDPSAHLVSNILVVGNATETNQLLIKISSNNNSIVKTFPSSGTVIGPRQRAFFSITFTGLSLLDPTSSSSSSSSSSSLTPSRNHQMPDNNNNNRVTLVKSSQLLQQLSQTKIEVTVQDVNSGEAHHSVPLRLHLRKADQGQPFGCSPQVGGNNPYHFWINSVCLSNRFHDSTRELPYVKTVLPVFLMKAPKEDMMKMAKEAITKNSSSNNHSNNSPTLSNVDSYTLPSPINRRKSFSGGLEGVDGLISNNNNTHSITNNNHNITTSQFADDESSVLHTIDLENCQSFVISVNIGVLRGLLMSNSSSVGMKCPTYKVVASPLPEANNLRTQENEIRNRILFSSGTRETREEGDEEGKNNEKDENRSSPTTTEEGVLEFLRFETGEVFPSTAGSLRWDTPLVFRRKRKNNSHSNNNTRNNTSSNNRSSSSTGGNSNSGSGWQNCRVGLRLVEIAPGGDTSSTSSSNNENNNNNLSSSSQGNVIAESILNFAFPSPTSSVPTVLSQPLVFVVRPCYPNYDALRTTSWLVKGTVVALAGNV